VVEGTYYFGKPKYVWTRIYQTKCHKRSYSNHVWTWTHWMFISMCHCVALKLIIWTRGHNHILIHIACGVFIHCVRQFFDCWHMWKICPPTKFLHGNPS
jgi:hypothetical protein